MENTQFQFNPTGQCILVGYNTSSLKDFFFLTCEEGHEREEDTIYLCAKHETLQEKVESF